MSVFNASICPGIYLLPTVNIYIFLQLCKIHVIYFPYPVVLILYTFIHYEFACNHTIIIMVLANVYSIIILQVRVEVIMTESSILFCLFTEIKWRPSWTRVAIDRSTSAVQSASALRSNKFHRFPRKP